MHPAKSWQIEVDDAQSYPASADGNRVVHRFRCRMCAGGEHDHCDRKTGPENGDSGNRSALRGAISMKLDALGIKLLTSFPREKGPGFQEAL